MIAFNKLCPSGFTEVLATQMRHKSWDGFAYYDMIFPLFLFIAGISFSFSYAKSLKKGKTKKQIYVNILKRCLILIALGVVYNGFFKLDFENLRIASVLEWTLFFSVLGLNSITIYMAQRIINFRYTAQFFGEGLAKLVPENVAPLINAIFFIAVSWFFLYFLYRKKIFLKV